MIDSSNNVRVAYLALLNGYISYNSINVPVYGQVPFTTTPKNYIVIGDISESSNNTNNSFSNKVDVVIDIFSEQYRVNDVSVVDDIASQVLNKLIPTSGVNPIIDAQFQIFPMARTSSRYLPLQNGDNYVARKVITISNLVNQI